MQQEIEAGEAIMKKNNQTKVTLHYDTTYRSRIPGEWPMAYYKHTASHYAF